MTRPCATPACSGITPPDHPLRRPYRLCVPCARARQRLMKRRQRGLEGPGVAVGAMDPNPPTKPCLTPHCPRQTPPGHRFHFCVPCREARQRRAVTPSDRPHRVPAPRRVTVSTAGSWWMRVPRESFTAAAEQELDRMNPSKGAEMARQMEVARLW